MSSLHEFEALFAPEVLNPALAQRSAHMRTVISRLAPKVDISGVSDLAFQYAAPYLWMDGALGDHPLEQLLCAWMPERLAGCVKRCRILLDESGYAYVPQIGMVRVREHEIEVLPHLAIHPDIQVHRQRSTMSDAFIGRDVLLLAPWSLESKLRRSMELLDSHAPALFRALSEVTHEIVLFNTSNGASFVPDGVPGVAFIHVSEQPTVSFIIEELAHQGGHLLLSAVTHSPKAYFRAGYDQPLIESSVDQRSRYVVLHGLFTLAMICAALSLVLLSCALTKCEALEAAGRIGFAGRRFEKGALAILKSNVLTARGLEVVEAAAIAVRGSALEHKDLIAKLTLSGHGYDFSAKVFHSLNG